MMSTLFKKKNRERHQTYGDILVNAYQLLSNSYLNYLSYFVDLWRLIF